VLGNKGLLIVIQITLDLRILDQLIPEFPSVLAAKSAIFFLLHPADFDLIERFIRTKEIDPALRKCKRKKIALLAAS
jgi:hypothetical protein